MSSTFILDNGSYTIKAGRTTDKNPKIIPNFVFKTGSDSYVGNEIDDCLDPGGIFLNSPFDRGYLVHLDVENEIWQYVFRREFGVDFADTRLVLTDSNLAVPTIDIGVKEVLFETYGLDSLLMTSSSALIGRRQFVRSSKPHGLVIDAGHSFTHIVPFLLGLPCLEQTVRIDVGGKYMTNMLRDKVSYSQVDVKNEFRIVSEMKEDVCSFATDFRATLNKLRETKECVEYYLPDFNLIRRGCFRSPSEPAAFNDLTAIKLGPERYVIPEILFHPDLINVDQVGLKDAILKVCNGTFDYDVFGKYMLQNICVVGGSAALPGLKDRLLHDLSNVFCVDDVPSNLASCLDIAPDPITEPWRAAAFLLETDPTFSKLFVSKKEYNDRGNSYEGRFKQFAPMDWFDIPETVWHDDSGKVVVNTPSPTKHSSKRRAQTVIVVEGGGDSPPRPSVPEKVRKVSVPKEKVEKPKKKEKLPLKKEKKLKNKPLPIEPDTVEAPTEMPSTSEPSTSEESTNKTPKIPKGRRISKPLQADAPQIEPIPATSEPPKPKKPRQPRKTKPTEPPSIGRSSMIRAPLSGIPQPPRIVAPIRAQNIYVVGPGGQTVQAVPVSAAPSGMAPPQFRAPGSTQPFVRGPRQPGVSGQPQHIVRRVFYRATTADGSTVNVARLQRPQSMQQMPMTVRPIPVMMPRRPSRMIETEMGPRRFISASPQRLMTTVVPASPRFVTRLLTPVASASTRPSGPRQPIPVVTLRDSSVDSDNQSEDPTKSGSLSPMPVLTSVRPPLLRPLSSETLSLPRQSSNVPRPPSNVPRPASKNKIIRPVKGRIPVNKSHSQAVYNQCRVEEEYDSPDSSPSTPTPNQK